MARGKKSFDLADAMFKGVTGKNRSRTTFNKKKAKEEFKKIASAATGVIPKRFQLLPRFRKAKVRGKKIK